MDHVTWRKDEEGAVCAYRVKDGIEEKVPWYPQPGSQELFLRSDVFETMYHGNRGPGKTDALIMSFAWHTGPRQIDELTGKRLGGWGIDWRGILFRKTFPQLTEVIKKTKKWFPRLFPGIKYNGSYHTWTWPTGETLRFAYMETEDHYENYHGNEYPWIGWEEITLWGTPEMYTGMMSCCRSSTPGMPEMYRSTTNPHGCGHSWVKSRFKLPCDDHTVLKIIEPEDGKGKQRCSIKGALVENKIMLNAQPDYINTIVEAANGDSAKLQAWVKGNWDIISGGMFGDVWNHKVHVIEPFPIPHTWSIYRAFDWGGVKPFSVGWWAVSDGCDYKDAYGDLRSSVRGDLFRIGEWYGFTGKDNQGLSLLNEEIASGIVEHELLLGIHHLCKPGPADSAIWKVEGGASVARSMMKPVRVNGKIYRISFVKSDKSPGSRVNGWQLMRSYFNNSKRIKELPREKSGLFVYNTCEQFIRTVPVLSRDKIKTEDIDTNLEDHIADESRYFIRFVSKRTRSGQTKGGSY